MTPFLFHGPSSRDRAVQKSEECSRPISDPVGDRGLKVDDARSIVDLANNGGVGDLPPSVVVGPIDAATPEAADALLKTLEDLSEAPLKIVLWADHLTEVVPTIRSRTREVWCPAGPTYLSSHAHLEDDAKVLLKAIVTKDALKILGALEASLDKDWILLFQALCDEMSKGLEGSDHLTLLETWGRMRRAMDGVGSTTLAIDILLPQEVI